MSSLTIVTTFFDLDGSGRYLPLLDRWLAATREIAPHARIVVLTDSRDFPVRWTATFIPRVSVREDYRDVIRAGPGVDPRCTAFDLKGALLCESLQHFAQFLALDLDAMLVSDPSVLLAGLLGSPIAMPADQGARRAAGASFPGYLARPWHEVRKFNAGVMWFGRPNGRREQLVADYRGAWSDLRTLHEPKPSPAGTMIPSPEKPALLEQSSWSLVWHRNRDNFAAVLPDTMNWPVDHLGPNRLALVHHCAGARKWRACGPTGPQAASPAISRPGEMARDDRASDLPPGSSATCTASA